MWHPSACCMHPSSMRCFKAVAQVLIGRPEVVRERLRGILVELHPRRQPGRLDHERPKVRQKAERLLALAEPAAVLVFGAIRDDGTSVATLAKFTARADSSRQRRAAARVERPRALRAMSATAPSCACRQATVASQLFLRWKGGAHLEATRALESAQSAAKGK